MTRGEDFYKLLGAMYDLRNKTFDAEEAVAFIFHEADSLTREKLNALTSKLEDFDELLTANIIELLEAMKKFEEE